MSEPGAGLASGRRMLAQAREAITRELTGQPAEPSEAPDLAAPGACFVTLRLGGELRGCIGSLEPRQPLIEDLRHNAVMAAIGDPRFPPLTADELPGLEIEISELTPSEPIPCADFETLTAALRPGVDGVVVAYRGRRATFLPQVWEQLPEPADFLRRLWDKAKLPPGFWHPELKVFRYGVKKWTEETLRSSDSSSGRGGRAGSR